jgi:endonuclease YncB( thermonuclease family)
MNNLAIRTALTLALTLALPSIVLAEVLVARVVGVTDGDTITVLDSANTQYKVRLAGIDAPEKAQAFGQASKQALSDYVYDRHVRIEWEKVDRYKRIIGKVSTSGNDVNLRQINLGLAWHYKKYSSEQSEYDARTYADAESSARSRRMGLWAEPTPVEPWVWRKKR